jgi:hypothetical protein
MGFDLRDGVKKVLFAAEADARRRNRQGLLAADHPTFSLESGSSRSGPGSRSSSGRFAGMTVRWSTPRDGERGAIVGISWTWTAK